MKNALARALAACTLALPLVSHPASACSVCLAGDPQFSTHGATSQEAGSFSFYLEALGFRKTSGLLPHGGEEADPEAGDHETKQARVSIPTEVVKTGGSGTACAQEAVPV
jgi:hypothetical protein